MFGKKIILFIAISFCLLVSCNVKGAEEPKYNKTEQIQEYEEKPGNNNEKFYKNLLIRLINNKIAITDQQGKHFFKDQFSEYYIDSLPKSKFYIFDINGDHILDIGICFPSNVLETYYYHPETDTLSKALDDHMYTEVLGNAQILKVAQTGTWISYQYNVINVVGEPVITIRFEKDFISGDEKSDIYSLVIDINLINSEKDKKRESYTVEVTKEQWDSLIEPLMELRKNAPKPFTYDELMASE